jgi:hypothetical protein
MKQQTSELIDEYEPPSKLWRGVWFALRVSFVFWLLVFGVIWLAVRALRS